MPERTRLGLIGVGRWGRNVVRACASLKDHVSLVAVASRNPDTPALVPSNCTVYSDWLQMLEDSGIDGLIIATPPAVHAEMALAAIDHGLPVLVEKPLTMALGEAEAIRSAARAANVPVMVDHIHLYSPAFRCLLNLAHEMGPLRAIIGSAGNHGPYRADVSVLWDWGPHDIAMNLALTGSSPSEVSVRRLQSSLVDGVVAENIEIAMTFPDDIHSRITIGTMMEKQRIFAAFLEKGTLVYDDLAQAKLVLHPPGATGRVPKIGGQIIDYENHPPLNEVIREFSEVAVGRQAVDHSLDIGVSVVSILTQADKHLVSI